MIDYIVMLEDEISGHYETLEYAKYDCEMLVSLSPGKYLRKSFYIYKRVKDNKFLYNNLYTHGIWVDNVDGEMIIMNMQPFDFEGTAIKIDTVNGIKVED